MAEYIEREDAIRKAKMANHDTNCGYVDWEQDERTELYINDIPTADVREVVTCAKCRYYSEKRKKCGHVNGLSELVFPTDYCSYGSIMREVDDDD